MPESPCKLSPASVRKSLVQRIQDHRKEGALGNSQPRTQDSGLQLTSNQVCCAVQGRTKNNKTDYSYLLILASVNAAPLAVKKIPRLIACMEHQRNTPGWNPRTVRRGPHMYGFATMMSPKKKTLSCSQIFQILGWKNNTWTEKIINSFPKIKMLLAC